MTTILACLDDSAAARPVLLAARAAAPLFGAEIDAVHVAENAPSTPADEARSLGMPLRVLHGDVVDALAGAASERGVEAVVIGARRRTLGPRSTGHVVGQLADRTLAPLLVVPPEAKVPERLTKALVAMKGTPRSARHLKRAVELVAQSGLEVVVVHVDDERSVPSFSDQVQHEVGAYAEEFLDRYAPGVAGSQLRLRVGEPIEEILRTADDVGAEVIAVGYRPGVLSDRDRVPAALLERSHVPVLLVTLA